MLPLRWVLLTGVFAGCGACQDSDPSVRGAARTGVRSDASGGGNGTSGTDGAQKGWVVAFREDFETLSIGTPSWKTDTYPDDGPGGG